MERKLGRWSKWSTKRTNDIYLAAKYLGLQDIDIRRVRYPYHMDAMEVETWNRRRFRLSGIEVHKVL